MKPAIALLSIVLMAAAFAPATLAEAPDSIRLDAEAIARGAEARAGLPLFSFESNVTFMARAKGGGGMTPIEGFNRRADYDIECNDGSTSTCSGSLEYCLGYCHGFCGGPCHEESDDPGVA